VDRKLGDALEERTVTKEKLSYEPARRLLSLIPCHGKEAFRCPETDMYNIVAAILRFLCNEIFNEEFYSPIGHREQKFMVSVEKSMRNLEPRRDTITWRTWRSETYTAIASRPQFGQIREKRKELLTVTLTAMLGIFIPRAHNLNLQTSVRNTIIEPAFALAHKMHLSVDYFSIEWPKYHKLRSDRGNGEFSDVELVDLARRTTLKAPPSGNIDYIFDITPQLVFQRVKADTCAEPKVLKKLRILVAVTKEGYGRNRESELRSGSDATVLGWLHQEISGLDGRGFIRRILEGE